MKEACGVPAEPGVWIFGFKNKSQILHTKIQFSPGCHEKQAQLMQQLTWKCVEKSPGKGN